MTEGLGAQEEGGELWACKAWEDATVCHPRELFCCLVYTPLSFGLRLGAQQTESQNTRQRAWRRLGNSRVCGMQHLGVCCHL